MKRSIFRVAAATMAAITPVAMSPLTTPAQASDLKPDHYVADGVQPAKIFDRPTSSDTGKEWNARLKNFQKMGYRVREITAVSPAMDNREIPLLLIQPSISVIGGADTKKVGDTGEFETLPGKYPLGTVPELHNLPTLYLLNGADGGEGTANWMNQSDIVQYYGGNSNKDNGVISGGIRANIVIPMSGAFSYYSDWVKDVPVLGGKQKWETFMTQELPQALEPVLHANNNRAIAGMSMTGTTSLLYAEHYPGFYDAVGSFSGCAATTTGLAPQFINITLNRGGTNMDDMWGGTNTEVARHNDALLNAHKLKGQKNIYVSNGSGLVGPHDVLSSPRVRGQLSSAAKVAVEGGVIEAATNTCTHDLHAKTNALGIPVTYNFRPQGTHQWGYWQDDLRSFRPVLEKGLWPGGRPQTAVDEMAKLAGEQNTSLPSGAGSSGSTPQQPRTTEQVDPKRKDPAQNQPKVGA